MSKMKNWHSRFHHNAKPWTFTSSTSQWRLLSWRNHAQCCMIHNFTSGRSRRRPENVHCLSSLFWSWCNSSFSWKALSLGEDSAPEWLESDEDFLLLITDGWCCHSGASGMWVGKPLATGNDWTGTRDRISDVVWFGTTERGLDSTPVGSGTTKRRLGSIDARASSLGFDFAISVSKVKRFSSCFKRNLYSSRNWRFLRIAASAFSSAMCAASLALTTDRDVPLLFCEPLRVECSDFLRV